MSVINQMLKDLEQRQQGAEGAAVYVAPARQQGWWMLLLTLLCGLALGILGWRTWIYWQQTRAVAPQANVVSEQATPDAVARVAEPVASAASAEVAASLPLPRQVEPAEEEAEDEASLAQGEGAPFDASSEIDERTPTDEELQPELYAELAALSERKATTAMAKGNMRDAQDNYYDVLAHDPYNQGAREQLAGLLYGEGRLTEARHLLEEGIRLDPQQADFRLLLARLAISEGLQQQALGWLAGYQPDLASNLDYYATWAGLAQELGQHVEAANLYVKLLRQQPDQGRWWLGLGVAEDGQGHSQRALDAYRNAQLHGNLGEASTSWLEQRIAQLAP